MRKTVALIFLVLLLLAVVSECRKRGKVTNDKNNSKGKKQKEKV